MCFFSNTTSETFKLITSENLKKSSKHRAHKRIVLRLNIFIFSPPKFLYNPWSCSRVIKVFLFLVGGAGSGGWEEEGGVNDNKFFVRSSYNNGNLDLLGFVSCLFELLISPLLDEI